MAAPAHAPSLQRFVAQALRGACGRPPLKQARRQRCSIVYQTSSNVLLPDGRLRVAACARPPARAPGGSRGRGRRAWAAGAAHQRGGGSMGRGQRARSRRPAIC